MGWRPWNCFRNHFTQQTARMAIDALAVRNRTVKGEPGLVSSITDRFVTDLKQLGWKPDSVVGPEARGFIFGPLVAQRLRIPFFMMRKKGKLPGPVMECAY